MHKHILSFFLFFFSFSILLLKVTLFLLLFSLKLKTQNSNSFSVSSIISWLWRILKYCFVFFWKVVKSNRYAFVKTLTVLQVRAAMVLFTFFELTMLKEIEIISSNTQVQIVCFLFGFFCDLWLLYTILWFELFLKNGEFDFMMCFRSFHSEDSWQTGRFNYQNRSLWNRNAIINCICHWQR